MGERRRRAVVRADRNRRGSAMVMDIVDLMQRTLDRTNDPDAIFALDRGITEIERLREALKSISKIPNSESAYGIIQVFVDDALKEKE